MVCKRKPLWQVISALGRLPDPKGFAETQAVVERFRAFAAIQLITDADLWESIARRRREDMLMYLALARFRKRPRLSQLSLTLQRDMKAFFGAYRRACAEADALLFQAGDAAAIDLACQRSTIGKLVPDDLYVHKSALDSLAPILRIYESCGRAYLGEVDVEKGDWTFQWQRQRSCRRRKVQSPFSTGANIIKIHRRSGKLSYLVYPDFDTDPHPALVRCVKLNLRTRQIECYDYAQSPNPPVLHRKENFLRPEHELYAEFARLTAQEEKHGLLDNASGIGTREGWVRRLSERGFAVKGHRLFKCCAAAGQRPCKRKTHWHCPDRIE